MDLPWIPCHGLASLALSWGTRTGAIEGLLEKKSHWAVTIDTVRSGLLLDNLLLVKLEEKKKLVLSRT